MLGTNIIEGLQVTNDWGRGESGTILSVGTETVSDDLKDFKSIYD